MFPVLASPSPRSFSSSHIHLQSPPSPTQSYAGITGSPSRTRLTLSTAHLCSPPSILGTRIQALLSLSASILQGWLLLLQSLSAFLGSSSFPWPIRLPWQQPSFPLSGSTFLQHEQRPCPLFLSLAPSSLSPAMQEPGKEPLDLIASICAPPHSVLCA